MRSVLRSYIPLFVWLALALFALVATPARAGEGPQADPMPREASAVVNSCPPLCRPN